MADFIIGIDLGTSNCAVAYTPARVAQVRDFPVPQLVRPNEHGARPLLPSVLYAPGEWEKELAKEGETFITGEFARWSAARVPGRVATSAKSWLIHQGVDRQAPILPWGAADDVPRVSPVGAQTALLRHLARAWDQAHPDAPLNHQEVVLTIPASFDEAARALTLQAARDAGFDLNRLSLLEEPQAAFYDFTARHHDSLAKTLHDVKLVLVVDVGGGTTDFSLVQVAMLPEGPALKRVAVGEHLLLGGDNMDAALARLIESKLKTRLNGTQWAQALHLAREAKETSLRQRGDGPIKLTLAGTGSKLIGNTLSCELTHDEIFEVTARGFFPVVDASSTPITAKRGAVVELGLPYATDAAITRHVVAFLKAHVAQADGVQRPDAILLNGGVFNSPVLTQALVDSVSAIWPSSPKIPLLAHDSLDLAVARGAAYSGLARRALGRKIGGGAPRAFYVAVGDNQGVCLIPRGLEEGETVELTQRTFTLKLGQPVQVQVYSTTADRLDKPGDVVELQESFTALPPIHTILEGSKGAAVQVHLVATLTEVGTLALSCVAGAQRWRLEFALRGSSKAQLTVTQAMPARFSEATTEIERVFGTKPLPVQPKDIKQLFRTLEKLLGPRESWPVPVLRELWTALFAGVGKRRRSVDHEKVMFQLLGFTLRPGAGYPLDDWRVEQTFGIFKELLTNHGEQPVWNEFWVLWRRVAGGLSENAQLAVWAVLQPVLLRRVPVGVPAPKEKLKGVVPQGLDEMVRCAASLELLPVDAKVQLGEWLVSRLGAPDTVGGPWAWALGRLGARLPIYGAAHRVVSADTARAWAQVLLTLDRKQHDGALFALTQLARRTGDRTADLDDETRAQVLAALDSAPESWRQLVAEVVPLSQADEARALGDTLPAGLTL